MGEKIMGSKSAACVLILLSTITLVAESSPCTDIGDEPNHRLLYQNDAVRIFQLDLGGSKSTNEFCVSHGYLRVIATEGKTSDVVTGQVSYQRMWKPGQALFVYEPKQKAIRNETALAFREYDIEALQPVTYDPRTESTCGNPSVELQCDPDLVSNHIVTDVHGPFTVRKIALGTGDQLVIEEASHLVVALSTVELTYGKDKQLKLEPGDAARLPMSEIVLRNTGSRKAYFIAVDF